MKTPLAILLPLAALAVVAAAGVNSLLGLTSVAVLYFGLWLLWRPGLSPVFAFIFGYQWLQACTKVFEANLRGVPIDDLAQFAGDVTTATYYSLAALVVLAVGIRLGLGQPTQWQPRQSVIDIDIDDKPALFWFWLYVAAFGVAQVAHSIAYVSPGLSQPLLALASLKWAFYWILTHVALRKGGVVRWLWLVFFLFELGSGVTGYFSDFKMVLFFTMMAVLSSHLKLTAVRLLGLATLLTLAVILAVAWTAIKTEQRRFLSQNERAQVVRVTTQESIANILELAGHLDMEAMTQATALLASRLAYVDFFGNVIQVVPEDVPYEGGDIWGDAILRPFMPRLFFPDKTSIDDSERTANYTGLRVSGQEMGTSVSLGYVAESYIDFGPWFMMLPILALGGAYGRFYRWLVNYRFSRGMIGMALATATLYPAAYLESSITKLFGGLVVAGLVAWVIARVVVPRLKSAGLQKARPGALP
jgi:hypothetical protein